jgi:GNAT superfamily N-acetyltransferase
MPSAELAAGCFVRPAEVGDARMIIGLLTELGYPDNEVDAVRRRLGDWAEESDSAVLVAERGGQLLGLVAVTTIRYLERDGRLGRIVTLVVADSARGQGIGRRLVADAEAMALSHGCVAMEVSSARGRTRAHAFYQSLGYVDKCDAGARFVRDLVPGASANTYAARFPDGDMSAPK